MFSLARTSGRQREILEVVFRNGWDYMRRLLSGSRAGTPELPPPQVLRNILVELGPVFVKLGQLLSTRPDLLQASYIQTLTDLQANVPPVAWPEVEGILKAELEQPLEDIFQEIHHKPIAAGSIAQTHYGVLLDGTPVALKVQRPGLKTIVEQDMDLIQGVAELVSLTDWGQDYDIQGLVREFAQALQAELDFTEEAHFTDTLRHNLAQSRWFNAEKLTVPQINWELTRSKVLVMEWMKGSPLLRAREWEAEADRSEARIVATLLVRSFFQQVCLDGFFHADPHPGNWFYLEDGRVALLDCGMVGRLDPRTQEILLELILAIVSLDAQRCAQLTLKLSPSDRPVNLIRLESDYELLLRQYYALSLDELNFSQLFYEVLQIARQSRIRVPGNLGLCAKCIANLEGVARSLDPEFNFPERLRPLMADLFQEQLVGDAPLPALLRTLLDIKSLGLRSPRQVELLLDRLSSETLRWNLKVQDFDRFRQTIEASGNRLAFSIITGSLILGASLLYSPTQGSQLGWFSIGLFLIASLLSFWLIGSMLLSGWLK
jgi:predicted unusual protein kinase regulating ubiquinone biosynthesis (AarF/ABC1/UbiB family)